MSAMQANSDNLNQCLDEREQELLRLLHELARCDLLLSNANDKIKRLTDQMTEGRESFARLAGTSGHELNNLLTIIAGHADILLISLRPNDPIRSSIDAIIAAVARATSLTRQLILFKQSSVSNT